MNASNIAGVVPILVLTYLNFSIIRTMKKNNLVHNKMRSVERSKYMNSQNMNIVSILFLRRDQTMTALLSGVVVVLVVCHTPKTVINIYECYQVKIYINEP